MSVGLHIPADMNTETRRKAADKYHAKIAGEGFKRVTFWLSPEAQAALDRLALRIGSKIAAVEHALEALDKKTPGG